MLMCHELARTGTLMNLVFTGKVKYRGPRDTQDEVGKRHCDTKLAKTSLCAKNGEIGHRTVHISLQG